MNRTSVEMQAYSDTRFPGEALLRDGMGNKSDSWILSTAPFFFVKAPMMGDVVHLSH